MEVREGAVGGSRGGCKQLASRSTDSSGMEWDGEDLWRERRDLVCTAQDNLFAVKFLDRVLVAFNPSKLRSLLCLLVSVVGPVARRECMLPRCMFLLHCCAFLFCCILLLCCNASC